MRPRPMSAGSDLVRAVERQMRNWELSRAQRIAELRPVPAERDVASFVTISRAVGAQGGAVATLLGERLKWPVFDREILHAMAGDDQLRTRLYEHLDEHDVGWLEDTVRWLLRGEFRQDDYFGRLTEAILALARQGHAVFLGRGADLILPQDRGLRVRITASLPYRAHVHAQRHQITEALAIAEIERIDRDRADFVGHHFGPPANAEGRYHVELNTERLGVEQSVELIRCALRLRKLLDE